MRLSRADELLRWKQSKDCDALLGVGPLRKQVSTGSAPPKASSSVELKAPVGMISMGASACLRTKAPTKPTLGLGCVMRCKCKFMIIYLNSFATDFPREYQGIKIMWSETP
jgi:hypothetical protein